MRVVVKGPSRAERALETRRRVLVAAAELFADPGYAATTMGEIAARAGVAVQTLYYTFRTKGQLLVAVVEHVAWGTVETGSASATPWLRAALEEDDPRALLALVVREGTGIYARMAPLLPAVQEAQVDADAAAYWRLVGERRKEGMRALLRRVEALGALRVDVDRGADVVHVLHSHETYRGLVVLSGWSEEEYVAWVLQALERELLVAGG